MRIGIVSDVHEAVAPLRQALAEFRNRGVDQVVALGDICDSFSRAGKSAEVVALLRDAQAVGVWGNHDFGLCRNVPEQVRHDAAPELLEFMASLQPYLVLEGCRFSHVEPWLDATQVENLWYFESIPDTPATAARTFASVPEHRLFMGHLHRWLVMTPEGRRAWNGETPLALEGDTRFLIVVAAVVNGWCAIYDTALSQLIPIQLELALDT